MTLPPFQAFLHAYRDDVYRFLRATVGPDEADDCFQETFIAALRSYDGLAPGSNARAWVLTIAHRKAIDAARSRARRAVPVPSVPEAPTRGQDGFDDELWSLVRELPPKQRAAVAHRFVNDLAYRELAAVMACSEEAARRSVHEGLRKLREVWTG